MFGKCDCISESNRSERKWQFDWRLAGAQSEAAVWERDNPWVELTDDGTSGEDETTKPSCDGRSFALSEYSEGPIKPPNHNPK